MMSKKTRSPNFSSNEKEILVHLITKYKDVVENKRTDATTSNIKNKAWKKLSDEFNSLSSFSARNTEQLKTCWDNIKRNTRKDNALAKKEISRTGRGRPNIPPTGPYQGQVEMILRPTLSGLENSFDSDAQYSVKDDTPISIKNEVDVTESKNITILGESILGTDAVKLVQEYEPFAGPSTKSDESSTLVQKNESIGASEISKEDKYLTIVTENRKTWNGWTPAAPKTKVIDTLVSKKRDSPSWLQRRRPKTSLHLALVQSKLELVELMKANAESEAKIKNLILEEQLKQEKLKTQALELKLKEALEK